MIKQWGKELKGEQRAQLYIEVGLANRLGSSVILFFDSNISQSEFHVCIVNLWKNDFMVN